MLADLKVGRGLAALAAFVRHLVSYCGHSAPFDLRLTGPARGSRAPATNRLIARIARLVRVCLATAYDK
jgi:hypothetical protein